MKSLLITSPPTDDCASMAIIMASTSSRRKSFAISSSVLVFIGVPNIASSAATNLPMLAE